MLALSRATAKATIRTARGRFSQAAASLLPATMDTELRLEFFENDI